MKVSKWLYILVPVIVFSIAACISCSSIKPVELKRVESVKILNSSSEGIDMEVNMVISNPNFLKFTITEGDLNIVLNKVDMGKAALQNKVTIPAHSEVSQKFVIRVGYSNALLGGFASLLSLFKSNMATIGIKGTVRARSLGISRVFPIDETTKIPFSY
jgi:LEA14-like dessication related protein